MQCLIGELNPRQSGLMKSGLLLLNRILFTACDGSLNALCCSLTSLFAVIQMVLQNWLMIAPVVLISSTRQLHNCAYSYIKGFIPFVLTPSRYGLGEQKISPHPSP